MRLLRVSIEGYRSIKEKLEVTLDRGVTVLLGANDHGKTNFLQALTHLNAAKGFEPDDLNWDRAERAENLPSLRYELELSQQEQATLLRLESAARLASAASDAREEAADQWREASRELKEAEASHDEAKGATDNLGIEFKAATEAQAASPEDKALLDNQTALRDKLIHAEQRQQELRTIADEKLVDVDLLALSYAIADGRAIEAEAVKRGETTELVVERAASDQEAVVETRSRSLKRVSNKLKAARGALEELAPEDEKRTQLEAEINTLASEEEKASNESGEQATKANQLRAAADAIARINEKDVAAVARDLPMIQLGELPDPPHHLAVSRSGVDGSLVAEIPESFEESAVEEFLDGHLPEVVMVEPVDKLPDDVSLNQLEQSNYAFMRGIFLYAGLFPNEWRSIFSQDSRTSMRLEQASEKLNETLRASWSQGKELTFRLAHDSKRSRITLEIKDPAVATTFTKPSRRSSGFTHFFALKTILHALQSESEASSYLWVFDEPGIHLHPDGQRDLIQVMETLSQTNQVLYTTHSIFLVNQNYPTRHRLLVRAKGGTVLDAKPFLSRWRTALDALGLSLAGTILFAPHVLLVEGDSDGVFLAATLRRLIADGSIDIDLNRFAAVATGDAANTDILLRLLTDGAPGSGRPMVGVLVDGDDGGRKRLKAIESVASERNTAIKELAAGTTLEDHIPAAHRLYLDAVCLYLEQMANLDAETIASLRASFKARFGDGETVSGLVAWTRGEAMEIAALEGKPSSVGIARTYAGLLEDATLTAKETQRARRLADWISEALDLPPQTLSQESILEE